MRKTALILITIIFILSSSLFIYTTLNNNKIFEKYKENQKLIQDESKIQEKIEEEIKNIETNIKEIKETKKELLEEVNLWEKMEKYLQ